MPDGDDEVLPQEHHDLAHLDGGDVLEVVQRLEHDEDGVVITFELGTLVSVDGVLHGQRVQLSLYARRFKSIQRAAQS
jgi:hypothetical protein